MSGIDDRATPADYFAKLDARFGFTVDVAASDENRKCSRYWTLRDDGLSQPWGGERVYCNPPYSDIGPWVRKAWAEPQAQLVVMLLPADRTERPWWQELIEPFRDRPGSVLRTEFLPGRLPFGTPDPSKYGARNRPRFGCVLCIWDWSVLRGGSDACSVPARDVVWRG